MDKTVAAFIEGFTMAVITFLVVGGILCLAVLVLILLLVSLAVSLILAPFAIVLALIKYFWPREGKELKVEL